MSQHSKQDEILEPSSVDNPQGEVAVREDTPQEPDKFGQWIADRNAEGSDPNIDPYQRIIEQILSASSPDEVLTPIEALGGNDVVDRPLLLHGFDMNESDYDQGSPFYVSLKCTDPATSEAMVVNTGHKKVIAQVVMLGNFNQFPYQIMFRHQGRSKKSGDPMLTLVKWQ